MATGHRLLLLLTGLLAAYHIVVGIDGLGGPAAVAYTVAFGVLLLAGLLVLVLGFEALESPVVASVSTLIPLSLSLGLVWQYLPEGRGGYLAFVGIGLACVLLTRFLQVSAKLRVAVLAGVHAVAGLTVFGLPIALVASGRAAGGFVLVALGGATIGIGGLLLSFLKAGRPILPRLTLLNLLPLLLFLMTALLVGGFAFA